MRKTLRPSGGLILDIDSTEIGDQFLSLAHNVHTRKGFPSTLGGRRVAYPQAFGAPTDPYHLMNLSIGGFNYWILFGTNNIKAISCVPPAAAIITDISIAGQHAITNPFEWSSTILNGIPVFTNNKEPLMFWNGNVVSDAAAVPGWPAATFCKLVVAFKFHLFALDITDPGGAFPNVIKWSAAADPGTLPASWTPSASNEAGSAFLADTPGRCVIGAPLNTQLMVYKPESFYAVEYVGQQPANIFSTRAVSRAIGAVGPHSVIELHGKHLILGNDDVVLSDGINTHSIADNKVKLGIANTMNQNFATNAFIIRDIWNREVWICIPELGQQFCTKAYVWDERRDLWSTRAVNFAKHGTTGIVDDVDGSDPVDFPIISQKPHVVISLTDLGTGFKEIYVNDSSNVPDQQPSLAKYDLVFDDETQVKVTSRITWGGNANDPANPGWTNTNMRMGSRQSLNDPIVWGNFKAWTSEGVPYEVTGRYISWEMSATGFPITLDRVTIEAVYNGPF